MNEPSITFAGITATPVSDQLMGYGNHLSARHRVLSRVRWRVELPGDERPLYLEATHRLDDGVESTTLVEYVRAGIYSGPLERELPGSGAPAQAVRAFVEQLAAIYWIGRALRPRADR